MEIVLTVLITVIADFTLGYIYSRRKKAKEQRANELFLTALENILTDENVGYLKRKQNAMQFCRNANFEAATGAYLVLDKFNYT